MYLLTLLEYYAWKVGDMYTVVMDVQQPRYLYTALYVEGRVIYTSMYVYPTFHIRVDTNTSMSTYECIGTLQYMYAYLLGPPTSSY